MAKKDKKTSGIIFLIVGIVYILNFGFGFLEFIPDNLALIGNIDEGFAGALILEGLRRLKWKK